MVQSCSPAHKASIAVKHKKPKGTTSSSDTSLREATPGLGCFCGRPAPRPPSCRCRRNPTGCRRRRGRTGSPRLRSSSGTRSGDATWTPRWCSWWRPGRGGSTAAAAPPWRKPRQRPAPPAGTRSPWTTAPTWRWAKLQTWKIYPLLLGCIRAECTTPHRYSHHSPQQ